MAIGLGTIFGFHFLENFNQPYLATSITDFWRRWHISLSSWFKDYVYIPLGGSRVKTMIHIRNILIVWLLTGFWHGASWNFIIWGLYFAILLLIEKYLLKNIKIKKVYGHIITMFLVMISWVIFRTENINSLMLILSKLFVYQKSNWLQFFTENASLFMNFYILALGIFFCFSHKSMIKWCSNGVKSVFLYLAILLINLVFIIGNAYNPFIYFRF